MKQIYLLFSGLFLLLANVACDKNDKIVIPTAISNLTAEPREGAIMLRWDIPRDSNYLFIRLEYVKPREDYKRVYQNISIFTDSLLVSDLLARDGEYHFTLQTVSESGTFSGAIEDVKCTALPVLPLETVYAEKIPLEESMLSSNAADPSQGKLGDLIDGNLKTFFHTNWHATIPYPQWIEILLPDEKPEAIQITTWNTNGRNNENPEEIKILGSEDGKTWDELVHVYENVPNKGGEKFELPIVKLEKPYAYIRYNVLKSYGNPWFNIAEIELKKVWYDIYDPENGEY